jgi:hypothetical protein
MSRPLGILLTLLFLCSSCTAPVDEYGQFLRNVEAVVRERSVAAESTPEPNDQLASDENPEYFCALGDTAFRAEYTITSSDGVIRKTALIDFQQGRFRFQTLDDLLIFYPMHIHFYRYIGTGWEDLADLVLDGQFFLEIMAEIYFGFSTLDPYVSVDVPMPNLIVERTLMGNDQLDGTLANVYEYAKFVPSLTGERRSLEGITRVWVDAETNQCLKAERVFRGELFRAVYSYPEDLSVPDPMAEP